MFQANKLPMKIVSVATNNEKHGDEDVLAVSVTVEFVIPNTKLSEFHERLPKALYFKDRSVIGAQKQSDLPTVETDAPNLLCPRIESPLKLDYEGAGYRALLTYGISGSLARVVLDDARISNFRLDPKEGGSVKVKARIYKSGVDAQEVGHLNLMLGKLSDVTLTPPEAATYEDKPERPKKAKGERVFAGALDGQAENPLH